MGDVQVQRDQLFEIVTPLLVSFFPQKYLVKCPQVTELINACNLKSTAAASVDLKRSSEVTVVTAKPVLYLWWCIGGGVGWGW